METLENKKVVLENNILAYLTKTAKHLFTDDNGNFFKILPYKKDGKWYCMEISFNGDKTLISRIDITSKIESYGSNTKSVLQGMLFPQHYNKKTSIPNFKEMRKRMFEVYKIASMGTNEDIHEILKGLEPKK